MCKPPCLSCKVDFQKNDILWPASIRTEAVCVVASGIRLEGMLPVVLVILSGCAVLVPTLAVALFLIALRGRPSRPD